MLRQMYILRKVASAHASVSNFTHWPFAVLQLKNCTVASRIFPSDPLSKLINTAINVGFTTCSKYSLYFFTKKIDCVLFFSFLTRHLKITHFLTEIEVFLLLVIMSSECPAHA